MFGLDDLAQFEALDALTREVMERGYCIVPKSGRLWLWRDGEAVASAAYTGNMLAGLRAALDEVNADLMAAVGGEAEA